MKNYIVLLAAFMSLNLSAQTLCDVFPSNSASTQASALAKAFGPSASKVDVISGYNYPHHLDRTNKGEMLFGKAYYPTSASEAFDVLQALPDSAWVKLVLKVSPTEYKTFSGRLNNSNNEIKVKGQLGTKFVSFYPNLNYLYAVTMEPKAWSSYYQGSLLVNVVNQVSKCFPQTIDQTLFGSFNGVSYEPGSMGVSYKITDLAISNNFLAFERVLNGKSSKELFIRKQTHMHFLEIDRPFPSHLRGLDDLKAQTNLVSARASKKNAFTLEILNQYGEVVDSANVGTRNSQHALSSEGTLLLTLSESNNTHYSIYTFNLFEIF